MKLFYVIAGECSRGLEAVHFKGFIEGENREDVLVKTLNKNFQSYYAGLSSISGLDDNWVEEEGEGVLSYSDDMGIYCYVSEDRCEVIDLWAGANLIRNCLKTV